MPKLLPQTIKIRNARIIKAVMIAKNKKELGYLTGHPGKNGSKDPDNSATILGTQNLALVQDSMLDAALAAGITPAKVAEKINVLLDAEKIRKVMRQGETIIEESEEDKMAIDKGITHSLKIGVGGGYAPEKSARTLNVDIKIENKELELLRQKYENELKTKLMT